MRSDFRENLANIIPLSPAPQRSDSGESDQKSHCALLLRNPGMGIALLRMDEVLELGRVANEEHGRGVPDQMPYALMNASKSSFTRFLCVVHSPCGAPL